MVTRAEEVVPSAAAVDASDGPLALPAGALVAAATAQARGAAVSVVACLAVAVDASDGPVALPAGALVLVAVAVVVVQAVATVTAAHNRRGS